MTIIVDDPDASNDRLVVTSAGELEARQPLDGDRVRRYTTAENADSFAPQTHSEFGLSIDNVIERYTAYADPETPRYQLAVSIATAFQRQIPSYTHETSPYVGDNLHGKRRLQCSEQRCSQTCTYAPAARNPLVEGILSVHPEVGDDDRERS